MQRIKTLGLALLAVCAMSAIAAAGASAHSFEASKASGLITAKADGSQVFTTPAGTLTCTKLTGHGSFVKAATLEQTVSVQYTSCSSSFGLSPEEPINTAYLFHADGAEVDILKPIVIKFVGGLCTITVPTQNGLKTITYKNTATHEILLESNISTIESSATGVCAYSTDHSGKYVGNALTAVVGGELKWS